MGPSPLTAKPGHYAYICMSVVEKVERESATVIWKKHRSSLKR